MNDNDVVRLPLKDSKLGSCPICGKPIWDSYLYLLFPKPPKDLVYKCIECKELVAKEDIIPF